MAFPELELPSSGTLTWKDWKRNNLSFRKLTRGPKRDSPNRSMLPMSESLRFNLITYHYLGTVNISNKEDETKGNAVGLCCFFCKNTVLRCKNKNMYICGLLFALYNSTQCFGLVQNRYISSHQKVTYSGHDITKNMFTWC